MKMGFWFWCWKYWVGGKEKCFVLGSYLDMGLSVVCDVWVDVVCLFKSGIDLLLQLKQLVVICLEVVQMIFEVVVCEWYSQQMGGWVLCYVVDVFKSLEQDVFLSIGVLLIMGIMLFMVFWVVWVIEVRLLIEMVCCVWQWILVVFVFVIVLGLVEVDLVVFICVVFKFLIKGW